MVYLNWQRLLKNIFKQLIFVLVLSNTALASGYGPWKFGMSKDQVRSVSKYGPYADVRVTGGVETPNGIFHGKKTNISFIFDDAGLSKIHIWAYEGKSLDEATMVWKGVYGYLLDTYGRVEVPQIRKKRGSEALDVNALGVAAKIHVDLVGKVQMAPKPMPSNAVVFSSFMKHKMRGTPYYYVFLYYDRP